MGADRDLDELEWLRIVMEEVGECARASHDGDVEHLREEIIQVIAANVQWLDALDRYIARQAVEQSSGSSSVA